MTKNAKEMGLNEVLGGYDVSFDTVVVFDEDRWDSKIEF